MKKALSFILLICFLSCLFSCQEKMKNVSYCEFGLSLPSYLEVYDSGGSFDLALKSEDLVVGIVRLSFEAAIDDGIPSTLSPLKFASLYRDLIEREDISTEPVQVGDVVYFTYTSDENGSELVYMPTFFKSFYAYFVVMFIGVSTDVESHVERCLEYGRTAYLEYPKN